ncbi:ATP synthase peripheral stalk subunit d, mitochondrial-like [Clavelina lepadiformis]|uniref:ATP synthase subunit d, mitochondrial n=1 Tax=Clavelina lepadiformis TaxID=159417 RepID=A0ABP0H1N7_CLALP
MAARQAVIKPVEWAKLQERIAPAMKGKFNTFKNKSDAVLANYMKTQEKKLTIDWGFYHQSIANKALVQDFEKKMKAFQVPKPVDTKSAILEKNIKEDNEKVVQFIKEGDESLSDVYEELNRLNSLPPFEQMTQEDVYMQFKSLRPNYEKYPAWPHVATPEDMLPKPR